MYSFNSYIHNIRSLSSGFLPKEAIKGGLWLIGGSILTQSARFARNIVLTRILAPESFGLMSIVLSAGFMVEALTEIGVKEAVIQSPRGGSKEYANSAWWLSFGRSVLIYGAAFSLAPEFARFYHNQNLVPLMRIALLSIVFNGAISPNAYVALKSMNYKKWAILQYGIGVATTILTVGLSFSLRSVWALAIGFAAEYGVRCAASYMLCPFFPRVLRRSEATRELLTFSRGVFGLSALNFVFARSDVFVLGKIIRPEALGVYTISIYLAQVPASFVTELLGQTLMPVFANIRSDFEKINRSLSRLTFAVFIPLLPAMALFALGGRATLSTLYGQRYSAGFWPLGAAIIVGFVNIANAQITTVLYALGKPQAHRTCVGVMAVSMIILLYPSIRLFGALGAQLSALIAMLVGYGIQYGKINQLTGFQFRRNQGLIASDIALER